MEKGGGLKRAKVFYLKHKPLLLRLLCFLGLAFLVIPLMIRFLAKNLASKVELNFFSFSAYVLAVMVSFFILKRKIIANYQFKFNLKPTVIYSTISFIFWAAYFYLKYLVSLKYAIEFLYISYLAYFLGLCFLALAVFGLDFFKRIWRSLLASLIAVYIYFMLTQIAWDNWHFFSAKIAKITYSILNLFYETASFSIGKGDPQLFLNNFSAVIGAPCSGIESLSMFIALFGLLVIYDYENLNFKRAGIVFFLGIAGTYFLNILRITLLMIIGTKYPKFALGAFHSQAGWILFACFILLLLYGSYGWMRKK